MEADMNNAVNLGIEQNIPPSFDGSEVGYLFALFGLLMVTLISLSWLWRLVWCMAKEDRQPLRSPVTVVRFVVVCLLVAALMRGTPDAILLIQWPELNPTQRLSIAGVDRYMDGMAFVPFGLAFLIDSLAGDVVQHQLKRQPPPPADLWPTRESLKGPVKIAAGCMAIAFAVVFLQ